MGKGFWVGVIVTLIVLSGGAYVFLTGGFANIRADSNGAAPEQWLGSAMIASVRRHAPKISNPVPPTEANLVQGARLYIDKCAGCHGSPVNPDSDLGKSFSPHAPQFFGAGPLMLPPHEAFYVIRHGVRMSAMPAWGSIMADSEAWEVIDLLENAKHLPAPVEQELRKPTAAPAP